MDIFAGSDEVVRFEPVGPGDEAAAQTETDYVNHVFMQQNDGFLILYGFLKDALLSKNGMVKVWWEEREKTEEETYYDIPDPQFMMLSQAVVQSDGKLEITAHSEKEKKDPVTGQPVKTHDVTIERTKNASRVRALGVPPEEFGIDRNARTISDANYCFHEVCSKTRADLIAEGYDENQVMALPEYTGWQNIESLARDSVWEHATPGQSSTNSAAQIVRFVEHYIRMDYEGNGKVLLYRVVTAGGDGDVLKKDGKLCVDEYDSMPFASCTPIPVTHRFFGRSIADLVIPIQQEKTALKRGFLDNLYLHNNTRTEVSESHAGPNTLDDLLVSRPGGIVRTKIPGGLNPIPVVDVTASVMPGLQYLDADLESKTGVSKQSQGIDANALQNQSATAVAQVFSASQMRMKLIARCLAEGVKDLFLLLHQTISKNASEQSQAYLRNQWVAIDPRDWKTREHMTINVALGNGSKAQQFAQIMALANAQKELLAGGKAHMVPDDRLFNTASEITKIMGHKNPDRFFADPSAKNPQTGQLLNPPQPPPPDPKVQIEQMKQQGEQQSAQQQMILQKQKQESDAAHQLLKAQADITLQQEKAKLEAELALIDAQIKKKQHQAEMQLKQMEMHQKQAVHEQKIVQMGIQNAHTQAQMHNENNKAEQADKTKKAHDDMTKAMADHSAKMDEDRNAPIDIQILRDPKTGRATGLRKSKAK
jgi:hypothetical protein